MVNTLLYQPQTSLEPTRVGVSLQEKKKTPSQCNAILPCVFIPFPFPFIPHIYSQPNPHQITRCALSTTTATTTPPTIPRTPSQKAQHIHVRCLLFLRCASSQLGLLSALVSSLLPSLVSRMAICLRECVCMSRCFASSCAAGPAVMVVQVLKCVRGRPEREREEGERREWR